MFGIVLAIGATTISAGIAIASTGSAMSGSLTERPEVFTRAVISVVFAEAIAIYGLLISFLILGSMETIHSTLALQYDAAFIGTNSPADVSAWITGIAVQQGYIALSAGLSIAVAGVSAGVGIAFAGSAATGAITEKPEVGFGPIISVVFAEALAIYGLLVAFLLLAEIVVPIAPPIFPTLP